MAADAARIEFMTGLKQAALSGRQLGRERFATFYRAAAQLLTDAGDAVQLF